MFQYKMNEVESFNVYFNKIYNTYYDDNGLKAFYKIIIPYYIKYSFLTNIKIHRFDLDGYNYSNIDYIQILLKTIDTSNNKTIFTNK